MGLSCMNCGSPIADGGGTPYVSEGLSLFLCSTCESSRCDKFALVAGLLFHCYHPRDEPHNVHEGFAFNSTNAYKTYTFRWEEGKKKDLELNLVTHISK